MNLETIQTDTHILLIDKSAEVKNCVFYKPFTKTIEETHYGFSIPLNEGYKIIASSPRIANVAEFSSVPDDVSANMWYIEHNMVKKYAMDVLKQKWSHLYINGYPNPPYPSQYESELNSIMVDKYSSLYHHTMVFSRKHLELCWNADKSTQTFDEFILSLNNIIKYEFIPDIDTIIKKVDTKIQGTWKPI